MGSLGDSIPCGGTDALTAGLGRADGGGLNGLGSLGDSTPCGGTGALTAGVDAIAAGGTDGGGFAIAGRGDEMLKGSNIATVKFRATST